MNMPNCTRWATHAMRAAALALAACAADNPVHREGLALLEQGRYEAAVAKLALAAGQEPENLVYRKDYLRAREEAGHRLVAVGNSARAAGQLAVAERAYREALRVDPGNGRAAQGMEEVARAERHAAAVSEAQALLDKGQAQAASVRLKPVFAESPNHGDALRLQRRINERIARDTAARPALSENFRKPVTLRFRDANLRMVFESIARTTGINILLDRDVRPDLTTTIFVQGTSVEDTLDLILMQNQLEKKVLSENTIFVYPNVPAKNKDYQDLKVRSFHLVYADVKQMQNMLKTILKTRDLFIHEKTNSLIMRDTPEAIRLAEKMIADQDIAEPEIMLEVEVIEITRSKLSELGIRYPDRLTLSPQTQNGLLTLGDLGRLNKDKLVVSPVPAVTLNAHLDTSNANVLASPRVRVRNREKAKILIGDRVPVLTNSVTPVATGAPVVTGTVSYIDVGLKLDVEPDIHSDGEVGIKVTMEVSNIVKEVVNPVSGTIAYQIGTRTAATVLRLKDGETQVLAGLINDEDRRTANMVPGLGQLPILGRLFSTHGINERKTEIVLSITPRLVGRTALQEAQHMEFWTGTESSLRSAPLTLRQTGVVAMAPGRAPASAAASSAPALAALGAAAATPPGAPRNTPLPASPRPEPAVQPVALALQGPEQARVGERFTLTVNVRSGAALGALEARLAYDAAALKAVSASEGAFLRQQGLPSRFSGDVEAAAGEIRLELGSNDPRGARGSGSVATVTFEVIADAPRSEIAVKGLAPLGASGEALPFIEPRPHAMRLQP